MRAAAAALEGVAVRTPLVEVPALSARAGVPVSLKCEQLQPIGAFKIRGAYNAIVQAGWAERGRAASSPSRAATTGRRRLRRPDASASGRWS